MKTIEQYFHVVLCIMLYKVVLTYKSVDETLVWPFKWKLTSSAFMWYCFVFHMKFGMFKFWALTLTGSERVKVHAGVNWGGIPSPLWRLTVSLASLPLRNIQATSGNGRTCWLKEMSRLRRSLSAPQWGEDEDWPGRQEAEMNNRWWTGETPGRKQADIWVPCTKVTQLQWRAPYSCHSTKFLINFWKLSDGFHLN